MSPSSRDPLHVPIENALDLHAFLPADIRSVVDEYVRAAHAAGLREVRLIHGRGIGMQRANVQALLKRLEWVEDFWDDASLGATVVVLSLECGTPQNA